jgi:hypothetical protein
MKLVNQLFELAKSLSNSQGFYGRLLEQLQEMNEDDLYDMENQMEQSLGLNPSDLDIILWLEC